MASRDDAQEVVECDLCQQPVSFFCRRCGVNLCDPCALKHLRVKSKIGHEIVDYVSKDDDDTCHCDSHPQNECSAFCRTCEAPICLLCVSIKHKSHEMSELSDKIEGIQKIIAEENDRLQSSKQELERILDHTTKLLSSLSLYYKQKKEEVTARGIEWHNLITETVDKLHQELDDMQKEHEDVLQKQKNECNELIAQMNEINGNTFKFQKSKNVTKMQKFQQVVKHQNEMKEIPKSSFVTTYGLHMKERHLQFFFGSVEKMKKRINAMSGKLLSEKELSDRRILDETTVTSVIDSGFPAYKVNNYRLYDMAVTDDNKVWMGGVTYELKLFDVQGHLHHTVSVTDQGMYICMYNNQVVYIDQSDKAVKTISGTDNVVTMFTTGDWEPYGITSSASGDLLVCLRKDDQNKVVRYSSTGTVLQEIQYDSQCQPLYENVVYVTENVNGDIIVTDWTKKAVVAVDRLGIFRYTYLGKDNNIQYSSVATDSTGHVIIPDFHGDKIHMLDRDGRFLGYIIPDGGMKDPRAVCVLGNGEMIVGEQNTGIAKRIKYLDN